MKIQAVRIIPFDLGFEINNKKLRAIQKIVKKKFNNELHCCEKNINNLEYSYYINISSQLKMIIFNDGIGEFIFYDTIKDYKSFSSENVKSILKKRRNFHTDILTHSHLISNIIESYLSKIRNLECEKTRRFTSKSTWESGGLSYVMSFYFIQGSLSKFSCEDKTNLLNLLFTTLNNENKKSAKDINEEIERHFVTLNNNVDVSSSWANFIVMSNNFEKHLEDYINVEINIQHMWFYTYILDKIIDDMFLVIKTKDATVNHINIAYNNLLNMETQINKYRGVISSIMHERDYLIYNSLIKSSKLDILIENILHKYELLYNRLNWLIDEKRYRSGKRVEIFVFLCTFFSAFTIVKDFKSSYWCDYWYFFVCVLGLTYILFFHKKR